MTIIKLTAAQCRMARAALQLGSRELARRAGISPTTVGLFERGKRSPTLDSLLAIQRVFEAEGLIFTNDDQPGVRIGPKKSA